MRGWAVLFSSLLAVYVKIIRIPWFSHSAYSSREVIPATCPNARLGVVCPLNGMVSRKLPGEGGVRFIRNHCLALRSIVFAARNPQKGRVLALSSDSAGVTPLLAA